MDNYKMDAIRNVAVMGHGKAGKTSLVEAMLFNSGAIDRIGTVADGTTVSDYDPEEVKRQLSIAAAMAPVECKNMKYNIIDTPGILILPARLRKGCALRAPRWLS